MARQATTRLYVSGYRFLLRRMEHALVRGDVRMLDDPIRAQSLSLIAGAVLAVIVVAACAVLAFFRPSGTLGSAPIVMVPETGALYVRVGDTVHPVLNLASARLIAGTPANPEAVSAAAVGNAQRGPLLGIPGAPAAISVPLGDDESGWAVCEDATSTTVIAGDLPGDGLAPGGVLVTPRAESAASTYLLYDGWRAKVDLRDRAVVRALKLDGVTPRSVSRALLDLTPEAPPIAAPHIPDLGSPSPVPGFPVGSVVRVDGAAANEYYVLLAPTRSTTATSPPSRQMSSAPHRSSRRFACQLFPSVAACLTTRLCAHTGSSARRARIPRWWWVIQCLSTAPAG
jgi:type VII secretion protein EccB